MTIGIDGRFWDESGVGRYIRNLVKELNDLDPKNEYILFVTNSAGISQKDLKSNWKVVRTNIRWHSLEEQLKYPSLLNSYNLDLVHFPYFSLPIFVNIPFVVTIHDLILHHFSTGKASTLPTPLYHLKRQGYKFVMKQAAEKSCKIMTVSEATKKEIHDHLGADSQKIVVSYEGVDAHLASSNKSKPKDPYFLYVGNAYPHKNLDRLFYAFSTLPDTSVKLIIAGQDDYFLKEAKRTVSHIYKNPNIIFKTDVTDVELSSLYHHALSLISPSLMEGFGLPLLEAMNTGCLVLASDIPSSREICKDAALYFDPYDVESLADKMNEVLVKQSAFESNRKKGKQRASLFSWKTMAKETLSVYEQCS